MNLRRQGKVAMGLVLCGQLAAAQISVFPYSEHFDSIPDSTLPAGWQTSTNRRPGGDFFASASSPRSSPHCLYSQNSNIAQTLISPVFDFTNRTPDKLQFYLARSSTHTSGLLIEASTDDGATFPIALSDTLKNPGTSSYVLNTIQIPNSLAHQSSARIRWRIVGGTGGSTATFRIDDVSLTTQISRDLAVGQLSVLPRFATSRDSLLVLVSLKNVGMQTATGYSVSFFCDLNNNLFPEANEVFAALSGIAIPPSDSTTIVTGRSALKAGDYRFFAVVSYPLDERATNDTSFTAVTIGYPQCSLLVNEIMYAPMGDEPEWIELLNCSNDTVNLKNWRVSDNNVSTKTVITPNSVLIPPAGFCIVAKDANFVAVHPSVHCPVVLTGFSALNNTTQDAVVLYESRLLTIDSVFYSPLWGGQGGKSLERIDVVQESTDANNWGESEDSVGSTPGRENSIVRMTNDLAIVRCSHQFIQSTGGVVPEITVVVRNVGRNPAQSYSVIFSNDRDGNGISEPSEIIATLNSTAPLSPSDSISFSYPWENVPQGESVLMILVEYLSDQREKNNTTGLTLSTSYSTHSLVVNEIMFDPFPGQNEWIELYNRGHNPIDLKNWKFSDRPTASGSTNSFSIAAKSVVLQPGEFALIAADSTIFNLFPYLASRQPGCTVIVLRTSGDFGFNNDGDDIVLRDLTGKTIDSVSYSSRWHRPDVTDTKGRSLERISPDLDSNLPTNWTTSVLAVGGTPGKPNSVLTQGKQTVSGLTFTPNPFSPDGDGFEDFCLVQYNLALSMPLIHVKIYDIKGRLIRTLANSQISAPRGELVWDGLNDDRQRVRIGPYVVLMRAVESNGAGSVTLKGVVVVAARL